MVEDEIIFERLTLLRNEIAYLRSEGESLARLEDYRDNPRLKRAIERSLQVAVEACLDMGRHIIAEKGLRFPEDNKEYSSLWRKKGSFRLPCCPDC